VSVPEKVPGGGQLKARTPLRADRVFSGSRGPAVTVIGPTLTSFTTRGALSKSGEERMNIISVYARSGVTAGPLNCAALPISPSTVWWKGPKPAAQQRAHAAAR